MATPQFKATPKKFLQDFLQEVHERADIVEVVSSFTELTRSGKEYVGRCPFHTEKTGSFTVTPSKQLAYCFGCSWGGGAIKFLQEAGRVSFADAILDLARANNIQVRYADGSTEDYRPAIPRPAIPIKTTPEEREPQPVKDYTVDESKVKQSVARLLADSRESAKALSWLQNRGINYDTIRHYRLGLATRAVSPDKSHPERKEYFPAITINIPVPNQPGRFYVKKRVAPWLTGEARPLYLEPWTQFGVPTTIWLAYNPPEGANETWFTEGEWDAVLLSELVRGTGERIAVACSTSGCGTLPRQEQLDKLPGQVTIFYDRDEAGEKGAKKLANALKERAKIASVPMPEGCQTQGWDVSDSIQHGYRWEDFKAAAAATEPAINPQPEEVQTYLATDSGIRFRVERRSLDEFLPTFPELKSEAGKDWLKMRQFTPDQTINSQYVVLPPELVGRHIAINSGLGTGKSTFAHKDVLADDNQGAVAVGYRNTVLIQFTANGKNWNHLQQDLKKSKEDLLLISDPHSRISACVDSLLYFQPDHFEKKILILDETEGTFKHLHESQTSVRYHRQICKQRMGQAIANSQATMLLDGNLTDLTVAHIEQISGEKFIKIKNLYQGNRGRVTYYTGTERNINDSSLLHKMMMEDSECFIVGADSQEKIQAWDDLLKAKGRRTFRLDGTNSNTPKAQEFLTNPALYIYLNCIEIVLYSPTAESGLSIDIEVRKRIDEHWEKIASIKGYFKRSYFFFCGLVSTNEQIQFLGRLRDSDTHIHVYCQSQYHQCGSPELVSEDLQRFSLEYALACSQISLAEVDPQAKQQKLTELAADLVQKSNDAHFQYECHLQAKKSFESKNTRKCLEYALRKDGYQVEVVTGYQADKSELEAAREANQVKWSQELFAASRLNSDHEAEKLARKFDATPEDKLQVARHRLVSRLPGIEEKTYTQTTTITVPAERLSEIQAGKVPGEIAQKLGIPITESQSQQALEGVHLLPNFSREQGEGGQELQGQGVGTLDQNQIGQNQGVAPSENLTQQALEGVHLPPNFSIKQGEGDLTFDIVETRPVFSPELIQRVNFQDRTLISRIEMHFLLEHPEIPKLVQQRRWYKKLRAFSDPEGADYSKHLDLMTYKSNWLKINTLLDMGIEHFLKPDASWTKHDPQVLAFWERGKEARLARFIGIAVGNSSPTEYIGRVLRMFDVKTKSRKVTTPSGDRIRVYSINTAYLESPTRSSIYESVGQRLTAAVGVDATVLDWDVILKNQGMALPETTAPQSQEGVHLPQISLINQADGGQLSSVQELAEELAIALAPDICPTQEDFALVVEGVEVSLVEEAITLQDSAPRRKQLRTWLKELSDEAASESKLVHLTEPARWSPGMLCRIVGRGLVPMVVKAVNGAIAVLSVANKVLDSGLEVVVDIGDLVPVPGETAT